MENKRGQMSWGMVTGLVFGIASLVIAIIIAFIITSTLSDADLIGYDQVDSYTITNESVTFVATNAVKTLSAGSIVYASCGTITYVANQTAIGELLTVGNYTQTGCTILNATALGAAIGNGTVYVSYPYTVSNTKSQDTINNLSSNFTAGINNVSDKLPTVLLIAAIVLILSVLAVLVGVWQRMRFGGGSL